MREQAWVSLLGENNRKGFKGSELFQSFTQVVDCRIRELFASIYMVNFAYSFVERELLCKINVQFFQSWKTCVLGLTASIKMLI